MSSPIFALMLRSFRVDARSLPVHLVRLLLVGVIFISLYAAYELSQQLGAPGLWFFGGVMWTNFGLITLGALSHFATPITEEKDERTLGLMRMTRLSPLAILLGKSGTRMITALMLLLVQLPFAILAVSLGGISAGQVLAAYVILAAYIVLVANAGLLASVVARHSRSAVSMMVLFLILFYGSPGILALMGVSLAEDYRPETQARAQGFFDAAEAVWNLNPASQLFVIASGGFTGTGLGTQFYSNVGAGVVFFLLALWGFELFNRSEGEAKRGSRGVFPKPWRKSKSDRVWAYPFVWKDFRQLVGGRPGLLIRFVIYFAIIAVQYNLDPYAHQADHFGAAMMSWAVGLGFLEVVLLAARFFRTEIRGQTLSVLMTLPAPLLAVVIGKIGGCLFALLPAFVLFWCGVYIAPDQFYEVLGQLLQEPASFTFCCFVVFFLQLTAYLSLWMKWGSVVAAFGICMVGNLLFQVIVVAIMMQGRMDGDSMAGLMAVTFMLLTLGMFVHSGVRLSILAAR